MEILYISLKTTILLSYDQWQHVATDENPADLATRGVKPAELSKTQIWWKGPPFLSESNKPKTKLDFINDTDLEERKIKTFHCEVKQPLEWERFSKLNRMVRVLSYCRRCIKPKCEPKLPYLTSQELKTTLDRVIMLDQKHHFAEEINDLKTKGFVKKRSSLITLSPFLDETGLLRVGGRLQEAKVAVEFKHPIIIPKTSHLTQLIIDDAHHKLLHGGIGLMINYLRTRYWIINIKQLVKQYFQKCTVCTRYKPYTNQPKMGQLPAVRVNPGRPFQTTGVDFAGPIQVRTSKGRGHKSQKAYIALFVCMKTRALHLEVVSALSTEAFIACFRRFVARRGRCTEMWSDNGLNFVGSSKELMKLFEESQKPFSREVIELLANDGTTWHFIPPHGPNFGGIWESGIKSVKSHIVKIIKDSTLTFEEMYTLLTQIEACLNSRPIGQLNDHPDDLTPLTPGHFLVGEPLILVPDVKHDITSMTTVDRWRLVQKMTLHFWNRWSKEYLHTLQQRFKWQNNSKRNPKIGELVILKEDDLPPAKWLTGRITDIHQGKDNQTRVVSVKCKNSVLKRPISKLVFLNIE